MAVGQIIPPYSTSKIKVVLKKDFIFKGEPILGRYLKVNFKRRGKDCIALLRVVNLQTENRTLTNAEMAQNATQIEGVKERIQKNDVLTIDCEVLTAFERNGDSYRRVNLDTIINSLEDVEFIDENLINQVIDRIKDDVFYLGKAIDENFDIPLVFQPFYVLNEAYHILISGQTGSGKSTEAKKILVAYAKSDKQKADEYRRNNKQYRKMNFLILDPVGEFAKSFQGRDTSHFPLDLGNIWNILGKREPEIYGIDEIALDRWDMLEVLMKKEGLLKTIAIKGAENQDIAIDIIIRELKARGGLSSLKRVPVRDLFDIIEANLERIYTQSNKREEVRNLMREPHIESEFEDKWLQIADWFDTSTGKRRIDSIVRDLTRNSDKTIIIDLSRLDWENPIKFMIIYSIFSTLIRAGEDAYQENDMLNTLVVIDEAHRIAPAKLPSDAEEYKRRTREKVVTAFRETRKLGIGWMVISTRISNLDTEIWEHARVKLFGFGLSTGKDADLLKELYGKNVLEIYKQKIWDPYDLMSERVHKFMIDGPVNVISKKIPEFYEAYNNVNEFLGKNGLDILSIFTS
ncbi:ATP-binding protein [Phorcysia thermohydrogeniphila]|uniref:Uncharacterized protein DUF87 n=1 Tax=Phorcysia thermohydrogeniphila TaxID=936138 RepID=A0A4R1G8D0_9BACT|nr:DUF87 domain-containing protein [Phorcysia thermohydrogeniphila]TCK03838.1 uncharacterized protein DUF87 [Phorcysia thermohydrogeniphila]